MSDHQHNNGFFNGFLFGVLIGAGLVFLLGTKRGKELIDDISEVGSSFLDDFIELFDGIEEDAPDEIQEPEVSEIPAAAAHLPLVEPPPPTQQLDDSPSPTPLYVSTLQKTASRRLFHGIPKKR